MKVKKLSGIGALIFLLLFVSFFLLGGKTEDKSGGKAEGSIGKVAYMWCLDAPFVRPHVESFKKTAEALNMEVVIFDAKWDTALQGTQVDDAILMDFDLLAIAPIDPQAIVPSIKKAYEAGIPVMTFNIPADKEADDYIVGFSGVGCYEQGLVAAELAYDSIGGKGNMVIVEGLTGYSACVLYQEAIDDYFIEKNAQIKTLGIQPTGWDVAEATKVTEDFITRFGSDIDLIYAHDDYLATGAKVAMEEAGLNAGDIKLIGIGGIGDALEMIKEGWMYGTVLQSPISEAEFEAQRCAEFLKKGKLDPFYKYIDNPKITKENVNNYKSEF
jgi:ribose transport system substrate-binding protein